MDQQYQTVGGQKEAGPHSEHRRAMEVDLGTGCG